MLLFLVWEIVDLWSCRFIHVKDKEEAPARQIKKVPRDNLHVLALRT